MRMSVAAWLRRLVTKERGLLVGAWVPDPDGERFRDLTLRRCLST